MNISDIITLQEVSKEYHVSVDTLRYRLKNLEENVDFKRIGKGQSIIITKDAVKKIVKGEK